MSASGAELRRAAQAAAAGVEVRPTSLVSYRCAGELLVIAPEPAAAAAVESLPATVSCTALAPREPGDTAPPRVGERTAADGGRAFTLIEAAIEMVSGHLGAFDVRLEDGASAARAAGRGRDHFDMVLDLGRVPRLAHEVPPPGYFAPGRDESAFHRALESIPELVGEFEKPLYVDYDPAICAHGERGKRGCTRCLDACPTVAVLSIGERVTVDPHLCQGTGGCAAACPTGAMSYAYPPRTDGLERLRRALEACHAAGADSPVLVFHDAEDGAAQTARLADALDDRVVPVELEAVATVGLETCLSALAWGAGAVAVVVTPATPATALATLERELAMTTRVLDGLGLAPGFATTLGPAADDDLARSLQAITASGSVVPAGFRPQADRRTHLRAVLDHLHQAAQAPAASVALPAGAPFGEVRADRDACTLCMACISVCPTKALDHGDERLQLKFREWQCVQCGMCEAACPERAITLAPRLLLAPEARRETRLLNEDEPFRCIQCGKPFGSPRLIERMTERLTGHRMFAGDAVNRIKMCEDCRVKDMF